MKIERTVFMILLAGFILILFSINTKIGHIADKGKEHAPTGFVTKDMLTSEFEKLCDKIEICNYSPLPKEMGKAGYLREFEGHDNVYLRVYWELEHGATYIVTPYDSIEEYCMTYIGASTGKGYTWGIFVTTGETPKEAYNQNVAYFLESPQMDWWEWRKISPWDDYNCDSAIKFIDSRLPT